MREYKVTMREAISLFIGTHPGGDDDIPYADVVVYLDKDAPGGWDWQETWTFNAGRYEGITEHARLIRIRGEWRKP